MMAHGTNLIDRTTGKLKGHVVRTVYKYVAGQLEKLPRDYQIVAYGAIAHHVNLRWQFAGGGNAQTIVLLRDALAQIERYGLIKVKPDTHSTVKVLLCFAPSEVRCKYGPDAVERIFIPGMKG